MKREIRRVFRELTPAERERVRKAREETERDKEELLAMGKRFKAEGKKPASKKSPAASVGERLKRLRTERELSQQAVAEAAAATPAARALEVTAKGLQSSLSQIESGVITNPGILTVDVLCRGLGVSISELLEN